MIEVIDGKLLGTKAKICVQMVNTDGDLQYNTPSYINDEFHHITKEYVKYINYYQKNRLETLGQTMYVPFDVWALGLVDTIKNDYLDTYDKDFRYVACAYCKERVGKKYKINFNALKDCLKDICRKAQSVHADVAIVWSDLVESVVKEVFDKSTVNVYLIKED